MKLNLKIASFLRTLFAMLIILIATSGFVEQPKVLPVGQVPDNIKVLLADYSQHINSGKTSHLSFYSAPVETLVKNRRDFYNEFYNIGLHTNLDSIKSEFNLETAIVTVATNTSHVELIETVTMFGYPIISKAEDYPMIPAAQWAISKTDDVSVKQALERYIATTTYGVSDSISNGVEITFRVHHNIDVQLKRGQLQFTKDEFTDKEIDSNGVDDVTWVNGGPARSKPDLTQMPDYAIYHSSIEVLGQQLLDDYTRAYGGTSSAVPASPTVITYGRTSAANYRSYSSNTTNTCPGNSSIFQDTSYYNQLAAYKSIWQYTGCDDCADYVSQALRQGNFPTDTNWNFTPSPGTYAWRVFDFSTYPGLAYYLQTTLGVITVYSSSSSLQLGDLAYTSGLHVVIVTGISPVRYSGHTNDRKDHSWDSSLNHYWHIHDTIG